MGVGDLAVVLLGDVLAVAKPRAHHVRRKGGTTGVLSVSTLTNNGTLIFNRSDAYTYSGIVSGTGAVTKQGAGTLTLTGTNSYTGATRVDGGSLFVNGRLGNTAVSMPLAFSSAAAARSTVRSRCWRAALCRPATAPGS